ncbi:MAG: aminoacetone oxidase family FAD-binding enzyme [Clostridia bacterium]|nr:aminoacetone oxidase family FAD-binding enzyme [Clostridia bacterium]
MPNRIPVVAILGGGASGLAAAISLGRELSRHGTPARIVIYEKLPDPGKKILATGNGRCNLSNNEVDISRYNGDSALLHTVLRHFGTEECIRFFHSLGLLVREEEGRLYPYSLNAASVREVLLREIDRLGIELRTGTPVTSLEKDSGGFLINGTDHADLVLFALGGKAAASQGTDGDGYRILKLLGIRYAPISPALVQIKTGSPESAAIVRRLKGIRARVRIRLQTEGGAMVGSEDGEILFTDYGVSGIAAMQLSGDAAVLSKDSRPSLVIDFCPDLPDTQVLSYLRDCQQIRDGGTAPDLLMGILNPAIGREILKKAGISETSPLSALTLQDLADLAGAIKAFPLTVTGTRGFKDAQVTRGGVPADQLRENTLESNTIDGLFFCGEILNADGVCGGYNLHFAWGSGLLAGHEAAERIETNI